MERKKAKKMGKYEELKSVAQKYTKMNECFTRNFYISDVDNYDVNAEKLL
jgi:hypothetical protein